jgi:hypothetical protein
MTSFSFISHFHLHCCLAMLSTCWAYQVKPGPPVWCSFRIDLALWFYLITIGCVDPTHHSTVHVTVFSALIRTRNSSAFSDIIVLNAFTEPNYWQSCRVLSFSVTRESGGGIGCIYDEPVAVSNAFVHILLTVCPPSWSLFAHIFTTFAQGLTFLRC